MTRAHWSQPSAGWHPGGSKLPVSGPRRSSQPTLVYMRMLPRVEVEALCWELVRGPEQSRRVLDLSAGGLRLERPYAGGPTPGEIQVEVELPEVDEIIWARGQVCFDRIRRAEPLPGQAGLGRIMRTTGIRLAAAGRRRPRPRL